MADLQEQLQSILSDPQAMSQIAAVARALTGSPVGGGTTQAGAALPGGGPGEGAPGQGPPTGAAPSPPPQGQDLSAPWSRGPVSGTDAPGGWQGQSPDASAGQGPVSGTDGPGRGEEDFLPVAGAGDGQEENISTSADLMTQKTGASAPENGGTAPQTGGMAPPVGDPNLDLSALLGALGGGGMDPRILSVALRVFAEYSSQDDDKAALLAALRPFLRPERQEKIEKAASIARLSRVVRVALALLREEGGHV